MTELERLRDRVEELEAACGLDWECPPAFKRGNRCRGRAWKLLCILAKRGRARVDAIHVVVWGDQDVAERPDPKIVQVIVCQLRPFLTAHGVVLETVWGEGYRFSPDMQRRALALVEELRGEGATVGKT